MIIYGLNGGVEATVASTYMHDAQCHYNYATSVLILLLNWMYMVPDIKKQEGYI